MNTIRLWLMQTCVNKLKEWQQDVSVVDIKKADLQVYVLVSFWAFTSIEKEDILSLHYRDLIFVLQ